MKVQPITTRIFKEGEDLVRFITAYLPRVKENSIIAVTSKIVALAEGRAAIIKNGKTKEKLIRGESEFAVPTKHVWLTITDGMFMASAGIDESNGNGKLILLPKDSFRSAQALRKKLRSRYRVNRLGILITDSRTAPLRAGVTGAAVGYAGFRGVKDYRGTRDIFGREFKFSQTNIADCLAAAAVVVMGEGNEQRPLALLEETPVAFCDKIQRRESRIGIKDDMYFPLFATWLASAKMRSQKNTK